MIRRILGYLFFLAFWALFGIIFLVILFSPFMAFGDIRAVIEYGAPKVNAYFIFLFLISLLLYLSMRVSLFRKMYSHIPVLWPLSQMLFITLTGLAFGLMFLNAWAENETISKGLAIFLTAISFILARSFMSYWYSKYPISVKMYK